MAFVLGGFVFRIISNLVEGKNDSVKCNSRLLEKPISDFILDNIPRIWKLNR